MAAYKEKKAKQNKTPRGNRISQKKTPSEGKYLTDNGNPDHYYDEKPAWSFASSDTEMWKFSEEHIGDIFWTKIFPRLQELEKLRWGEILIQGKKQNHSLDITELNKPAQERLESLCIEAGSLISLRIMGSHRLYGYMVGRVFNILWYDDNHGNNDDCVCRSNLKHT